MTSISQATMAASVLLGLISIPAVSETAMPKSNTQQKLPNLSSSESAPKQISRETTPEGFKAEIESAFSDFTAKISSESASASLESPDSDLHVERSASGTEWVFETPNGKMTIKKTSDSVVETTETPQGTLKVIKQDGGIKKKFKGSNRDKVEEARKQLRTKMENLKERMNQKRKKLSKRAMPDIEIHGNASTATDDDEYVVIVNNERRDVNLNGWKLQNEEKSSAPYEFGDISVEAGSRLRVYSEDEVSFDGKAVRGTGLSWDQGDDEAVLFNERGMKIEKEEWTD